MKLKVVTLSRKRIEMCAKMVERMPVDMVCVAESEAEGYRKAVSVEVITHPDEVIGAGKVFSWAVQNVDADCVVFCDDDVTKVSCLVGKRPRRIEGKEAIRRIIENTAEISAGIGAAYFSYALISNILDFVPQDPFSVTKGGGPVKGVFRKEVSFDDTLTYHADGDITLTCLLRDRVVFKDTRFCFDAPFNSIMGGSADLFSEEAFKRDCKYLEQKWGAPGTHWEYRDTGRTTPQGAKIIRVITKVRRRQPMELLNKDA